ncbi:hypothetical protein M5K25_024975 [Dendrobium thyrsiflorum]|uniref:Uncharacterized protein n=1 Tax=Dendrobium thyrsiflorum TaxID=117978 RepID=A0ABD0U8G5_DENTH
MHMNSIHVGRYRVVKVRNLSRDISVQNWIPKRKGYPLYDDTPLPFGSSVLDSSNTQSEKINLTFVEGFLFPFGYPERSLVVSGGEDSNGNTGSFLLCFQKLDNIPAIRSQIRFFQILIHNIQNIPCLRQFPAPAYKICRISTGHLIAYWSALLLPLLILLLLLLPTTCKAYIGNQLTITSVIFVAIVTAAAAAIPVAVVTGSETLQPVITFTLLADLFKVLLLPPFPNLPLPLIASIGTETGVPKTTFIQAPFFESQIP